MPEDKLEIITFKVPESVKKAMEGIPNRSEFLRNAVLSALGGLCPLCKGTGILLPNQQEHWEQFLKDHSVNRCQTCSAVYLKCEHQQGAHVHEPADKPY